MTPAVFGCPRQRLDGDVIRLDGPEGRHAVAVRRLRVGERVDLTDGAGLLVRCEVAAVVGREALDCRVVERVSVPSPSPRLVVVQAVVRGAEDAVTLMTEVGVDEIVPWQSARAQGRWRAHRWESAAREAAKQARRPWWPVVGSSPVATADVATRLARADLAVVLHESAAQRLVVVDVPGDGQIVVVVGPEGGLSDDEIEQLGAPSYRLGDTVLRSTTAGAAAAAALLSRTPRWG